LENTNTKPVKRVLKNIWLKLVLALAISNCEDGASTMAINISQVLLWYKSMSAGHLELAAMAQEKTHKL